MNRSKARQDIVISILLYALIAFAYFETAKLRLTDSKIFPHMIISVIFLLTTILFLRALWFFFKAPAQQQTENVKSKPPKEIWMPYVAFLGITAYVVIFHATNYFIASGLLIVIFLLVNKIRPLWKIVAITGGYLLFAYVLFVQLLNVRLF